MRRSINTIPKNEYDELLRQAMQRMSKKFRTLQEEEESKMIKAENEGDYEAAEKYDFNVRALFWMSEMYYKYFNLQKENENE